METTINGKKVKLYGKAEISKMFSNKVAEYLNNGYVFNVMDESSSGSQGEEIRASLTNDNGKTTVILWIGRDHKDFTDMLVFKAEKFENANNTTCWLDKGIEIEKKVLYQINDSWRNRIYCENKEDMEAIDKKRSERGNRKESSYRGEVVKSEKLKKLILKVVKTRKGYKTVKMSDISRIEKIKNCWQVLFYGKCPVIIRLNKGENK